MLQQVRERDIRSYENIVLEKKMKKRRKYFWMSKYFCKLRLCSKIRYWEIQNGGQQREAETLS
jgi:hypothetical protein